jgi:hypothetical protein
MYVCTPKNVSDHLLEVNAFCSYHNRWLIVYFAAIFAFNSFMILLPSTGSSASILKSTALFELNALDQAFKMSPLPQPFKWQLYLLLCCCGCGMALSEYALFKLFQKHNGRALWLVLGEKIRDYACFPLMKTFSRGKFFKFRAVAEQAAEVQLDNM